MHTEREQLKQQLRKYYETDADVTYSSRIMLMKVICASATNFYHSTFTSTETVYLRIINTNEFNPENLCDQ